jgi:hypothetical protein
LVTDKPDEKALPPASAVYPVNAAHMMRTAQLAQLQLSAMADAKASLLMGASCVIFTITIGQARNGMPPVPLLILGGAAFFAAIFAVLAVLPKTSSGKTNPRPNNLAAQDRGQHLPDDGAGHPPGGLGPAEQEIQDAGLGLSHLPARPGGELRRLHHPVSLTQRSQPCS